MQTLDLIVDKSQLRATRIDRGDSAALEPGQALLAVDKFGFSANNVTYALLGDALSYWRFFPAPDGWGRIPVWGFADVIEARDAGVQPGERFFGYFPMSTHLVVTPAPTSGGFRDDAQHRRALPAVYNHYMRVPARAAAVEAAEMLLRPLFFASFLVDDYLAEHDFFGAGSVVVTSASSKTAIGLAHLVSRRRTRPVIGLTSPANRAFVERLGCYDRVVLYQDVDSLELDGRAVLVDIAGSAGVRRAVHARLGERLAHSCIVGNTHGATPRLGGDEPLAGPQPQPFFGPAQLDKRNRQSGAEVVQAELAVAWREFLGPAARWLRVIESRGPVAVERVYQSLLDNRAQPEDGHVLSLQP